MSRRFLSVTLLKRVLGQESPRYRSNSDGWLTSTPAAAEGLQWEEGVDWLTPVTRRCLEDVDSPLAGSPAQRLFSWGWDSLLADIDVSLFEDIGGEWEWVEGDEEVFEEVIPLRDLDNDVTHELVLKDWENVPAVI